MANSKPYKNSTGSYRNTRRVHESSSQSQGCWGIDSKVAKLDLSTHPKSNLDSINLLRERKLLPLYLLPLITTLRLSVHRPQLQNRQLRNSLPLKSLQEKETLVTLLELLLSSDPPSSCANDSAFEIRTRMGEMEARPMTHREERSEKRQRLAGLPVKPTKHVNLSESRRWIR